MASFSGIISLLYLTKCKYAPNVNNDADECHMHITSEWQRGWYVQFTNTTQRKYKKQLQDKKKPNKLKISNVIFTVYQIKVMFFSIHIQLCSKVGTLVCVWIIFIKSGNEKRQK